MIELKVTGMHCAHCVRAVETALVGVAGVTRVEVDLDSASARVEGDPDPGALTAAIVAAGYGAEASDP